VKKTRHSSELAFSEKNLYRELDTFFAFAIATAKNTGTDVQWKKTLVSSSELAFSEKNLYRELDRFFLALSTAKNTRTDVSKQ